MLHFLTGGAFLGWALGANDSANVFGPGVASGAVKFRTATILTAVFALLGALVEGPRCIGTLNSLTSLVPASAFIAAAAAGLTILALTALSLPASTSQAIVGALIGIGLFNGSADFMPLMKVLICWGITPVMAAATAFLLYRAVGALMNRVARGISRFDTIVRIGILVAGCYGAYTLGANNAANVAAPLVGAGQMGPLAASLLAGATIGLGAITFSRRVMMTVGGRITALGPLAAFVAILSEGLTTHAFALLAVPVSSSQAIVGAVAGIGLVRGIHAVSGKTLAGILLGWFATPLAAGLAAFGAAASWSAVFHAQVLCTH